LYLHIGNSVIVPVVDILGVFDLYLNKSNITREFLQSKGEKEVVYTEDIKDCKSFVVTREKIYYSPIAPSTLKKRVEKFR